MVQTWLQSYCPFSDLILSLIRAYFSLEKCTKSSNYFSQHFLKVEKYFVLNQSDLCFPNRMEKVEFSQKWQISVWILSQTLLTICLSFTLNWHHQFLTGFFFSLARFCYVRNARVKSDIYLWCKRNFLIAYLQKKVRENYLDFRI